MIPLKYSLSRVLALRRPFLSVLPLVGLVTIFALAGAEAFVRAPESVGADGTPVYRLWGQGSIPIRFVINNQTSDALANVEAGSDPLNAIRMGFQAWEAVSTSSAAFIDGGLIGITNSGFDLVNVVSMVDSERFVSSGILGLTLSFVSPRGGAVGFAGGPVVQNSFPGQVVDSDIIFNRNERFTTLGNEELNDLESVATHEIGHLLGLDHVTILSATMRPFITVGATTSRSLDFDDAFAVSNLYPGAGAANLRERRGAIIGTIISTSGQPVFGANVVVVDRFSRTLGATLTLPSGRYDFTELFPGPYTLFIEPLDGPVESSDFLNFFRAFSAIGQEAATFPTVFHGGAVNPTTFNVTAQQTEVVNVAVDTSQTQFLNIRSLGQITAESSGGGTRFRFRSSKAVSVEPGSEITLAVLGNGINSSTEVRIGDPQISVTPSPQDSSRFAGSFSQLGGGVAVIVSIPAGITPGARNVIASDGTNQSVAVNGLDILGALQLDNVGGGELPSEPPQIALLLNQTSFPAGSALQLSASTQPGAPEIVDLYVAVQLPSGDLLFLGENIGPTASPLRRSTTPASGAEEIFAFRFDGSELSGSYTFFAAFTNPGVDPLQGGVVGSIASVPFNVP